jgi:hypothetical protein
MRILGVALLAVFALAAVAVSSASAAEPAFYECAKVSGGKYSDKNCSKPGEGKTAKYELKEGIGKKHTFTGKGGAATLHTPAVSGEVKCGAFKDSGTLTSPTTEGKVVSVFSKCTSIGKNCNSPGAKKGTIETNDLDGSLGYINKSKKEVGVDLKPESGKYLAEFNCEGLEIKVEGSVIGHQLGDIDTFSKTSEAVFKVNGEGYQDVKSFEGGSPDVLESTINGSGPFESGQEAKATNKGENLEVKA